MAWEPDYVTLAQAKAEMRLNALDVQDDTQIARNITTASRIVDLAAQRQFGLATGLEYRYYTPWFDADLGRWVAEIDDLMTTSGLLVAVDTSNDDTYSTTIATGRYVLRPRNAPGKNRPWTQISFLASANAALRYPDSVRLYCRPGWTTVPAAVEQANLLQMIRLGGRRDSPEAESKGKSKPGSRDDIQARLLATLDPDVWMMVLPYRRAVRP